MAVVQKMENHTKAFEMQMVTPNAGRLKLLGRLREASETNPEQDVVTLTCITRRAMRPSQIQSCHIRRPGIADPGFLQSSYLDTKRELKILCRYA